MTTYLLLMRHTDHETQANCGASRRQLTKDGRTKVTAVADRLTELSTISEAGVHLGSIRHAPSDEATQTAQAVQQRLGLNVDSQMDIDLSPNHMPLFQDIGRLRKLAIRLLSDVSSETNARTQTNAVLVIGHQPMLGWIAYALTGTPYPLSRSELLCISVDARGRGNLEWVLSPTDDDVVKQLTEKIKSKMDVAKVLSGFITVGLGFLLTSLVDEKRIALLGQSLWAAYVSAGLFFVSIGLYLATIYSYDSLLMPSRFWGEAPQNARKRPNWIVARPPSSVQWILYQNMIRIWSRLFTPATICVIAGLYFLAFAVMAAGAPWPSFRWWLYGAGVVTVVVVLLGYLGNFRRFTGPWVGSED